MHNDESARMLVRFQALMQEQEELATSMKELAEPFLMTDADKDAWRRKVALRSMLAMADALAHQPGALAEPVRGGVQEKPELEASDD